MNILFIWKLLKIILFIGGCIFTSYGIVSLFGYNGAAIATLVGGISSVIVSFFMDVHKNGRT